MIKNDVFISDSYIKFEKQEKRLIEISGFNSLRIPTDEKPYTEEEETILKNFNSKWNILYDKMVEETYKELYKIFRRITGHQLRYYGVDFDFFKSMVDENLGYEEQVYDLYLPDLEYNFKRVSELWETQRNDN